MELGLLHLHNFLRWAILILLVVSIIKAYAGWQQKKAFTPADRRLWLFTLIAAHTTFLIGTYQLLLGRYGILNTNLPEGESLMQNKFYRFFWVEHPFFMITAVVLITLGYRMSKKPIADTLKFKRVFWLFLVALLMVLVAVPWPFRDTIGRPWAPGMEIKK